MPAGSVFFALKGENFDGNAYAGQALRQGASLAVVDDPAYRGQKGCFVVEDVLETLQQLATLYRKSLKATVIGITGTNGKTTTKELVTAVLGRKYACRATKGNLNNHIGVPLTILSLPGEIEFAIIEMGANHRGEIAALSAIADPGYGIITNVGKAHLEGFGSFEGVVAAKTELYAHLRGNGGKAFINGGNEILLSKAGNLEKILYGETGNDVWGSVQQSGPTMKLNCFIGKEEVDVNTNLVGAYNLENVMAAACIGHYFGVETESIKAAIEEYMPVNNRSQVMMTPKNTLIMDAYNANPSSMEVAIANFAEGDYENKVLILGEMLELGKDSDAEHRKLVENVQRLGFSEVYLVGKSFDGIDPGDIPVFLSTDKLIESMLKMPLAGKTILIKGSRGNQLERIINYL